ncbi:MAG: heavy-metal-associated domain-containing protein [Oscillospiraceae bacterium]|nr:heavy-metal-associated domain-containing protein [Oscillospiraceae bacterium]
MKKSYKIEIDCANCAAKVENAVNKLEGVKKCTISFMTQKLTLETDCEDQSAIVREIERVGKKANSDFEIEAK